MRRLLLLIFTGAIGIAGSAHAQTVAGDRFTLNTGPCTMRSGVGVPPSTLGKVCDTYLDTGSGVLWLRQGVPPGAWVVPGGLAGSGTVNTLAKWATTTTLGNSAAITEDALTPSNVYLGPPGSIYVQPVGRYTLPNVGYTQNLGHLANKFLTLHAAELWVETLVAQDTLATIGGRIIVAPTTMLTRDLGPADTILYVKHNNLSQGVQGTRYGAILYLQSAGKFEAIHLSCAVACAPTLQGDGSWAYPGLLRNVDGSGANNWFAGDAVVDGGGIDVAGTNAGGWIDLYSTRGLRAGTEVGPTIVGNVRTDPAVSAYGYQPRWAIGNLNGLYGYSTNTYGAVFGKPGGARITIDDTLGLVMRDGANNVRVSITPAGTAGFSGDGNGVTNINGGNIQTGTVNANKITAGNGRNVLRNSECRVTTDDWVGYGTPTVGRSMPGWQLNNEEGTCYSQGPIVPAGSYVGAYNSAVFPVKPGMKLEASAYLGLHRVQAPYAYVQWVDSAGAAIGLDATTNQGTLTCGTGGVSLNNYCRVWSITNPAPGNAVSARFYILATTTGDPVNVPYIFFTRAYMGEAKATQTEPSEWSPAGLTEITGGMVRTDAILARHIASNQITTDELAANAVNASKIQAGSITGDEIKGGTITADKFNVTTLSAITANLGTVTAGTINGVTINGTNINGGSFVGGTINIGTGTFTVSSVGAVRSINLDNNNMIIRNSLNLPYLAAAPSTLQLVCVNPQGDLVRC